MIFGRNTKIYGENLGIQSKYGKIRTRKNSSFGHFSHSFYDEIISTHSPVRALEDLSERLYCLHSVRQIMASF